MIEQQPRNSKARVRRTAVAAVVGLLALSACTSDPGPKRVAQDIIEAEGLANPGLDTECLDEQLDEFSADDLKDIADLLSKSNADNQEEGREGLEELDAALSICGG